MKRIPPGNRKCNPLTPSYFYPGAAEKQDAVANDPYGEKTCSMSQANFNRVKQLGVDAVKDEVAKERVAGASS